MKDKTLIVKKKNVWGNERIYPVCNKAIIFSCIAASKTLKEAKQKATVYAENRKRVNK